MSRFYVSELAFTHYDFRLEHPQKESTEEAFHALVLKKFWLSDTRMYDKSGEYQVRVCLFRNKRSGMYGYRFHGAIVVNAPGIAPRYFVAKDEAYSGSAFIGAAWKAGLQWYYRTVEGLRPSSGITDPDGATLPPIFAALLPGIELDPCNSYSWEARNF